MSKNSGHFLVFLIHIICPILCFFFIFSRAKLDYYTAIIICDNILIFILLKVSVGNKSFYFTLLYYAIGIGLAAPWTSPVFMYHNLYNIL